MKIDHPSAVTPGTPIADRGGFEKTSIFSSVTILDLQGRRVRTFWQGWRMPGEYHVLRNGDTDIGVPAGTGLYLVRLQSQSGEEWLKMSLVK